MFEWGESRVKFHELALVDYLVPYNSPTQKYKGNFNIDFYEIVYP